MLWTIAATLCRVQNCRCFATTLLFNSICSFTRKCVQGMWTSLFTQPCLRLLCYSLSLPTLFTQPCLRLFTNEILITTIVYHFFCSRDKDVRDCFACTIHQFFESGSNNPKPVYDYMMAIPGLAEKFPLRVESDPCELMEVCSNTFICPAMLEYIYLSRLSF